MTINEALQLLKQLRRRVKDLSELRAKVSVEETWFGSKEKEIKPLYDVRALDRKIAELQAIEYEIEALIKEKNATTSIVVDATRVEKAIFEPLQ